MNKLSEFFAVSILVLVFVTNTVLSETEHQEFSVFNERYNEIIKNYDLDAFIELYGDNPLWIAPDTPAVSGLNVPRNTFGFIIEKQGSLTHTFDHLHLSDDGSQAVMTGTYDVHIEAVGKKAQGTYLFVLKREGDQWKIVVDMFNEHAGEEKK